MNGLPPTAKGLRPMTALGEHVIIEIPDKGVKLDIVASALAPPDVVLATADLSAGVPSGWTNRSNPGWAANAVTPTVANGEISIPASATHYQVFEAWPVTGLTPGDKVAIEFDYDAPAGSHPYVGANTAADLSGTWFGNDLVAGQAKTKQRINFTVPQANMWILFGNNVPATPTSTTTVKFSNIRLLRPFEVAVPPSANPLDMRVWQGGNLYDPGSYIRKPLLPDAPLLSNSAAIVADFNRQVAAYYGHMDIGINAWTAPVFYADETTPTGSVKSDSPNQDWAGPMHINEQLAAVPMPAGFAPSAGTDGELVVILRKKKPDNTYTYSMFEFWALRKDDTGRFTPDQWVCITGSRTDNIETDPGYYPLLHGTTNGLPWTFYPGATAAGLPNYPLLISAEDIKAGEIDHPLGVFVVEAASGFVWPATRTDGGEQVPIKEGMCLRFPVTLNFDNLSSPLARMIGKAVQKFGMYVYDRSGVVGFRGQDPLNLSPDPWWGPDGILGYPGGNANIYAYWPPVHLAQLPWDQLVAVDPRAGQNLTGG
jgi:hypothetical protein